MDIKKIFITTSLGTKWQNYSSSLIKKYFPNDKHIIVNGKKDFHPLNFLKETNNTSSDYTIHIDEDCFILNPEGINDIISDLEKEENTVLASSPDSGVAFRCFNPYACNLFFTVFKTKIIKDLIKKNPDWNNYTFDSQLKKQLGINSLKSEQKLISDGFKKCYNIMGKDWFKEDTATYLNPKKLTRKHLDERENYEKYYQFFWLILKNNYKIKYLDLKLNNKYFSSDVYYRKIDKPIVRHMWYLRQWNSDFKLPNGLSNKERYSLLEKQILQKKIN